MEMAESDKTIHSTVTGRMIFDLMFIYAMSRASLVTQRLNRILARGAQSGIERAD
jgi:hypothetical protein